MTMNESNPHEDRCERLEEGLQQEGAGGEGTGDTRGRETNFILVLGILICLVLRFYLHFFVRNKTKHPVARRMEHRVAAEKRVTSNIKSQEQEQEQEQDGSLVGARQSLATI